MKKFVAAALGFLWGASSCDLMEKSLTFEASPSRTVVITDTDAPDYDMRLSDIPGDRFIILTLLEEIGGADWASTVTLNMITKTGFTIGQIVDGRFEKKLVKANLDYWVASGSYWVAFFMADGRMKEADMGYLSKQKIYVPPGKSMIYLTNLNFMGNVETHVDIADLPGVPFD